MQAYINWFTMAGIARGPVFRKVDRWGNLAEDGINSNSLILMLRRIFKQAGVPADLYSSPLNASWLCDLGFSQRLGGAPSSEVVLPTRTMKWPL